VFALLAEAQRRTGAPSSVFFDSFLVILREGFEAILVVSALAAYLRKVGAASHLPWLYGGAAAAVAASVGLWALARTVVEISGAAREALEGWTMLVAAAVLFWVSYWLVSKAEAARWQAFVRRAATAALGRGALFGFGFLSFVVVFREGFETVLFYEALLARAGRGASAVVSGFGAGVVALAGVSFLWLRLGARIPLGLFFGLTGGLLYFLAFKFVGAGVFELQAAQVLSRTPFPAFPDRPWLRDWFGLYPSVEGLALQGVLVLLAGVAAAVTLAGGRTAEPQARRATPERRAAGGG
jgi:high-affinity iron transporter